MTAYIETAAGSTGHSRANGHAGRTGSSAEPPDMTILQRTIAAPPVLDLSGFGPLAGWIEQAAECKSAPRDYVALPLISAAAAAIGASRAVSPWSGWEEPAVVWTMIVGSPSASKSPAMDAVRDPLAAVEREAGAMWPTTMSKFDAEKVAAAAHRGLWEASVKESAKAGDPTPEKPQAAAEPAAPCMPRLMITDTTIEKCAEILAGNPRGIALWRDECAAWLGNIAKYGDGDRAYWLEAYGGRPYVVDRKSLPMPQRLPHLAVSVTGGIQPDRLSTLLMSGDDDGLFARFLYAWPDPVPPRQPTCRLDSEIVTHALRRLHALHFRAGAITGDPLPVVLPIEHSAIAVFQAWREAHYEASRSATGLMAGALGKMPGQVLRLALVLTLLMWAAGDDDTPEPREVTAEALGAGLDLMDGYFKPALARVLGEASAPLVDRQTATLAHAIVERQAMVINARDVRRGWRLPGLRDAATVEAAIRGLVEARWLIEAPTREGGSAGRQRADYRVDMQVHRGGAA